jgi:hypothetical protein
LGGESLVAAVARARPGTRLHLDPVQQQVLEEYRSKFSGQAATSDYGSSLQN